MLGWTSLGDGHASLHVERRFAHELDAIDEIAGDINRVNEEEDVRWLRSFLSSDRQKTFCLYEARDVGSIRRAAERAGLPADVIHELSGEVSNTGAFTPM